MAGESVPEEVPGVEGIRCHAAAVGGDYSAGDNAQDITVVGGFGAEIGCYRLRLAAFGCCNGGR
jgi:hypothetical protein